MSINTEDRLRRLEEQIKFQHQELVELAEAVDLLCSETDGGSNKKSASQIRRIVYDLKDQRPEW